MVKLTHSGTIIYATLVLIFVRQTAIKGLLKPNDSIYVNRCIYVWAHITRQCENGWYIYKIDYIYMYRYAKDDLNLLHLVCLI